MNDDIIIDVNSVTMKFNVSKDKIDSIKEFAIKLAKHQLKYSEFTALDNVSFKIKKGEVVGLVGFNGSGKSTMLKIIAGVMKPTAGKAAVNGTVAPLIEVGAGFNGDLSGRENVFLNGYLLGFTKEYITKHMEEIIEFAELGEFIDVPLKNYSSGMKARLGFAIATTVKPQILIVDEVLAVGDYKFQEKCQQRISDMMENDTTVLFVSHSIAQVRRLCSRCIWLDKGKILIDGPTDEVCDAYMKK